MKNKKLQIPTNTRAAITASSYNADTHTIEVVFATEIEVSRRTWDGTKYIEVLECKDKSVRLERANAGANLIDSHRTYGVDSIIGVVERAWVEGNECKATIRLSKREEVAGIVQDIVDGIIRNISVGYFIHETAITENADTNTINVRVTDWEPYEITILSVPADHTSGVRSAEEAKNNYYEINLKRTMDPEEVVTPPVTPPVEGNRGVQPPAQQPPVASEENIRKAELARIRGIEKHAKTVGLDDEYFVSGLVERGLSLQDASVEIINELGKRQGQPPRSQNPARVGVDGVDKKRSAMVNALEHRANPSVELKPEGRDFRGLSLVEMARECAEDAGIKTRGMSQREVAQAALNIGERSGMHSSSDFPNILANTVNRTLRAEYEIQERTFMPWTSRGTAKDFREITRTSLGEFDDLKEVKEGGEYEYGTIGEGKEAYKVVKYGRKIAITWETLINDDLGAFSRIPRKIAAAAARKQSDIVYSILTGSHKMSDNVELFHANHNNLINPGTEIAISSLTEMRKLIRKQKGLDKKDTLNLIAKYLICGPDNEELALQYTSSDYTATEAGKQNIWKGKFSPIIEDRIAGNAWFLAVNPSQLETIEYSFLEGEPELFTEQRNGFDVDGLEIKARMVFGAKAIDFRGLAKNPGV